MDTECKIFNIFFNFLSLLDPSNSPTRVCHAERTKRVDADSVVARMRAELREMNGGSGRAVEVSHDQKKVQACKVVVGQKMARYSTGYPSQD